MINVFRMEMVSHYFRLSQILYRKNLLVFDMKPARIFLYWLPMPVFGMLNGFLRVFGLMEIFNERTAGQLSVLTLITILAVYIYVVSHKVYSTIGQAWVTGSVWLLLTVCFEFALGYFVSKLSFQEMLADYDITRGRLWPLVLIGLLMLPPLCLRLRIYRTTK